MPLNGMRSHHSATILRLYIFLVFPSFFTFTSFVQAVPTSIWHVSIFEGPAPPAGKGAPLQASALRDKTYLPVQIASIGAAYVVALLVIGTAVLFVGRRLRRAAQESQKTLAIEMVKPGKGGLAQPLAAGLSPVNRTLYGPSPADTFDMQNNKWPSPSRSRRGSNGWGSLRRGHRKQASESVVSVITFDESVVEDDRAKNEKEMDRLYAAVAVHDEEKSASKVNMVADPRAATHAEQSHSQHPPELQHLRHTESGRHIEHNATMTTPPRSRNASPMKSLPTFPRNTSRPTPLSVHSHDSARSSRGSFSRRHGPRGLTISPPMGSPGLAPDYNDTYGDTEPLTPKFYEDPGPAPPTPDETRLQRYRQEQMASSGLSPRTDHFPMTSFGRGKGLSVPSSPGLHTETIHEDSIRPQLVSRPSMASTSSKKRAPPPLAIGTAPSSGTATPNRSHLAAPLPLRNLHPTNLNSDRPEPSPAIRATVLERKPQPAPLRTPMTGVPQTPYSAYMPYTPLTPMTPSRLVTRAERKRREKEEGRRVPTIEDAVEEEADMWGAAYP